MKRLFQILLLIMLACTCSYGQDGPPGMDRDNRHFKRLTALRNSTILVEMNLSAQSEKGGKLFDFMTEEAETMRYYQRTREELSNKLNELSVKKADEKELLDIVAAIETNEAEFHKKQLSLQAKLAELLTPVERAQFYVADYKFRQELHHLFRSRQSGEASRMGGRGRRF